MSKWKETWEEMVPGTQAGVRLHLAELVEMARTSLSSQSWSVKRQGAAAVATITETLGEREGSVLTPGSSIPVWSVEYYSACCNVLLLLAQTINFLLCMAYKMLYGNDRAVV